MVIIFVFEELKFDFWINLFMMNIEQVIWYPFDPRSVTNPMVVALTTYLIKGMKFKIL